MTAETKSFYKRVIWVSVPIMIQNGVTNFVGMLDNIMVGRVGTDSMSGVAIVNQLLFVWYLCFFGGLSGVGIFTAQFYGKRDEDGVRYTVRLQAILAVILLVIGAAVFLLGGDTLIRLYLTSDGGVGNVDATFGFAKEYLAVMLVGMIPFAISQVYDSTLRSCGETVAPMNASLLAVAVNLIGNYILIFGKFGAPAMGVVGAAVATCLSRVVEAGYLLIHTHRRGAKYPFMAGAFRSLYAPAGLIRGCVTKGAPLLANEFLWAAGQAVLTRNYSLRGLSVVAAFNISQTISNVFNIAFIAMGSAIAIIIGQELGAGHLKTVRRDANRLIWFSVLLCVISGVGLFAVSGVFPLIYNTSDDIRATAGGLIRIAALFMPMYAYENGAYFTLRSGGKTGITFLFDSCFQWIASVPVSYALARFTGLPILPLYALVQSVELIKCAIGFVLVKKGVWIQDLTNV